MISDKLAAMLAAEARKQGFDPVMVIALVEVEAPQGRTTEQDGRTPILLFEKHRFYRELVNKAPDKLKSATRAGLAVPHWLGHVEYADENTSARRLAIIAQARAIDAEAANRSASWGIGQTMGDEAPRLGFGSATAMVAYMVAGGIEAQIDCLCRELNAKRLKGPMAERDFSLIAYRYNGEGYRKNDYDTKLAAAARRWDRKLAAIKPEAAPVEQAMPPVEVSALQKRLRELGYVEIGKPNGVPGSRTVAGISAFQHEEGLPITGTLDEPTRAALDTATPRVVPDARATVTAGDLKKSSRTIAAASGASTAAAIKKWFGATLIGGGAAVQGGRILETAQDGVEKITQAKGIIDQARDALGDVGVWVFGDPKIIAIGVVVVIAAIVIERHIAKIVAARVDDERTGTHAGAIEGEAS